MLSVLPWYFSNCSKSFKFSYRKKYPDYDFYLYPETTNFKTSIRDYKNLLSQEIKKGIQPIKSREELPETCTYVDYSKENPNSPEVVIKLARD